MFTDSLARTASEMATQNAVKAIRDVDLERQIEVTLIGGLGLNPGRGTLSRPVQTCVYVVKNADWRPPPMLPGGECVTPERDAGVIAIERRVVAPSLVQQFLVKVPGDRQAFVVVDADFALRPTDYLPLSFRVDGRGTIRVSAWLDGSAIFDGSQPRPAPARPLAQPEEMSSAFGTVTNARDSGPAESAGAARAARMQVARDEARRPSESASERRLDLTLVGGRRLNAASGGPALPVQTCTYVVSHPDWHPPSPQLAAIRGEPARDAEVLASDCRPVEPNQLRQFQLDFRAASTLDLWLVVDADFAQRPASYTPLKLRLEGQGPLQVSAWLDGHTVFDGRRPLPPEAADAPEESTGSIPLLLRKPMQPLQPLPSRSAPRNDAGPKDPDESGGQR